MFSAHKQDNSSHQPIAYSVKIHISDEEYAQHHNSIDETFVNRLATSGTPVMYTTDLLKIIHPGDSLQLDCAQANKQSAADVITLDQLADYSCMVVSIQAKWIEASEKPAKTGKNANVFGSSGSLQLSDAIDTLPIPLHAANEVSPEFLANFNAQLLPTTSTISKFNSSPYELYLVTYHFGSSYIDDYVLRPDGGGGVFVEAHDFPHVFIPMDPSCQGGLILGQNTGNDYYSFAAFSIPFGYALHVKENTIHGDSFFTGPYSIALTDKGKASTVLFRTSDDEIQKLEQIPAKKLLGNNPSSLFSFAPMKKDTLENAQVNLFKPT